jgi:hypothetical protein
MYKRHRFPPEVIQHVVWLYHRFNLSSPELDRVGLELQLEFRIGASTQGEVEQFLADSEWPITYRLTMGPTWPLKLC